MRIQLTKNPNSQKPTACCVKLLNPIFDEIVTFASNKLQINKKKIRLFVCKGSKTVKFGFEITKDTNLFDVLCDDVMLYATSGNSQSQSTNRTKPIDKSIINKLPKPPRWPLPLTVITTVKFVNTNDDLCLSDVLTNTEESRSILVDDGLQQSDTLFSAEKNSIEFPLFDGNVYKRIKFVVKDDPNIEEIVTLDGYTSFDYKETTNYENDPIKRECRGLILSNKTGYVLARRYHKFYNIGENEHCLEEHLDFGKCVIYEKLDGSLVSPIAIDDNFNSLIWSTRRVRSLDVENFVNGNNKINEFANYWIKQNITPIFEWCVDESQPGIIKYNTKKLVLTALRHNITGKYISLNSQDAELSIIKYKIDTPKKYEFNSIDDLKNAVYLFNNCEGVVLHCENGNLYKLKSSWWINMNNANRHGGQDKFLYEIVKREKTLKRIPKNKFLTSVLNFNDDDISQICILLNDKNESREFLKFIQMATASINNLKKDLSVWVNEAFKITNDPDSIKTQIETNGWPSWIVDEILINNDFTILGTKRFTLFLCDLLKKNNDDIFEYLFDLSWTNSTCKFTDQILDIHTFSDCPETIKSHIIQSYLPKKFANMTGTKYITGDSIINIPRNYLPNEGKLIGMYEHFVKKGIHDLRIDLQPPSKEYSGHYGNMEYALFLVQHGLPGNPKEYPHGDFAGVLIPTDFNITYNHIQNAMETSFNTKKIIKIGRHFNVNSKFNIFCDLDQVLADFEGGVYKITGRKVNEQTVSKMWNKVLSNNGFFSNLEWMNDGKELWNHIKTYNPTILTGLPSTCKKNVQKEKNEWCNRELGIEYNVITCMSKDKYKYSNYNNILIDDRLENGKSWEQCGGTFIHHHNSKRTIYEFDRIFGRIKKKYIDFPTNELCKEIYSSSKNIEFINYVPNITDQIIGIDIEWDYKNKKVPISILQISTYDKVYIIDMIDMIDKKGLENILSNNKIYKVFYDINGEDISRLNCNICNVFDIKEWTVDCLERVWTNDNPSLSDVVSLLLKKTLHKTKDVQLGNWNERPLSEIQIQYAANDSNVLLDLYETIDTTTVTWKNIYSNEFRPNKRTKIETMEYDPTIPTKIIYSGIFLTPESMSTIKEMFPHEHSTIYYNHVTLCYKPTLFDLTKFQIGKDENIDIVGYYCDEKIQCVSVEIPGMTGNFHITLSCKSTVNPYESNLITDYTPLERITLNGIYGLFVTYNDDELISLPKKIRDKIRLFCETAQNGQTLKFKPNELSASERSVVHEFAKNNGMKSESSGKSDNRKIIITMMKNNKYNVNETKADLKIYEHPDEKPNEIHSNTFIVKDESIFKVMNIVYDDKIQKKKDGKLENDFVELSPDLHDILQKGKLLLILRGLPGSGKSWFANYICEEYDFNICSADYYFNTRDGYKFDKEKLQSAHDFCLDSSNRHMLNLHKVVIDNTNSKLSEYEKYINLANTYNYNYCVVEIICNNTNQALIFSKRSGHNVPQNISLEMYNRWETDDNAYYIYPYIENFHSNIVDDTSLQNWLTTLQLFHNSKKRNKTHLFGPLKDRPACFVDIPSEKKNEFYQRCYNSGIWGESNDEPKYLTEIIGEKFKMFFDFDFKHIVDEQFIIDICHCIQKYIKTQIYVTGLNRENSTGLHLKCSDCITDFSNSKIIFDKIIDELYINFSDYDWISIVDNNVYLTGLRMFGTRKITKGIDMGRVYKLMFCVDNDGSIIRDIHRDWTILEKLSIHC